MVGELLEMRYARRAVAYFGRWLRGIRVLLPERLDPAIENALRERLTPDEVQDALLLDVLVLGRLPVPPTPEQAEVLLAVEVSATIDRRDVERAQRRAALLRRAGLRAVPVVAGEGLTAGASEALQDAPVVMMLDGRAEGWEPALAAAPVGD
jgi:hypothetical protein